eukprot:TRINITY_DN28281_c0_g1_i2.p1 TRINITY_DN28281_c0_g1~~TRINITY_DN28281_c0_g1_i2.p1  ORF type:complete len:287 (-),score=51.78 TRINITY_DN28281_c0_g1_i2:93-953(-)
MLGGRYRSAPRLLRARDHKLSRLGLEQTQVLRSRIRAEKAAFLKTAEATAEQGSNLQGYYQHFFGGATSLVCSPLLRALQTAHRALHPADGWGRIRLLKNAREWLHVAIPLLKLPIERDCLGERGAVGQWIAERAKSADPDLVELPERVDPGDCGVQWWSAECETRADLEARVGKLWEELCSCEGEDCILVAHSNVFRCLAGQLAEKAAVPAAELLQEASRRKLQNAGVLGLRCGCSEAEKGWLVEDALFMFDTGFEQRRPKRRSRSMFSCCNTAKVSDPVFADIK